MPYLVIAARSMVIVVFLAAFVGKARGRHAFIRFVDSLDSFGVRRRALQLPAAYAVVAAEAAAAIFLVFPATVNYGLMLGGLTITVFTAAALLARRLGRQPTCNCFGSTTEVLGTRHVVRNCVIVATAIIGLAAQTTSGHAHIAPAGAVLAAGLAVIAGFAIATWDDVATLLMPAGSR